MRISKVTKTTFLKFLGLLLRDLGNAIVDGALGSDGDCNNSESNSHPKYMVYGGADE